MKSRTENLIWLTLVVSIFCLMSLYLRGPEPRVNNDYLSDIAVMRFHLGDLSSLIVTNRSPVLDFSIPYGAWPPLHTMIQAVWSLSGMKLEYARFMTGMVASLAFAGLTLLLLKKFVRTDAAIVTGAALISPIVIFFVWHGMTHVLIPCSAMAGLWLIAHTLEKESCDWKVNFGIGFILGLTDWFTYGLLPALFLSIVLVNSFDKDHQFVDKKLLYRLILSLALGFIAAFVSYKIAEHVVSSGSEIIFFKEGLTKTKLYNRIIPSAHQLSYAVFYTLIRFTIVIIPILLINRIVDGQKLRYAMQSMSSKFRFVLLVSMLTPLCFAIGFSAQVAPSNHRMQALSFLPFAVLLLGFLVSKTSISRFRKLISVGVLTLIAAYGIAGYRIVPAPLLVKETFPDLVHPLPIGDYDLRIDQPSISILKIIKTINNQIMTYPCCDERLVELNAFHASWSHIKQYGASIRKHTKPDEMLVYFGSFTPGFSYHTQRIGGRASRLEHLDYLIHKYSQRVNIALLLPVHSSVDKLYEVDSIHQSSVRTEPIDGTPYKLVRFKSNAIHEL